MPVAVVETIALALKSRLDAMVGSGSYSTEISEVQRPKRFADFTPRHNQIVLTQGPLDRVGELDRPGNPPANAYRQTFNIHCHVMQDERGQEAIDEMLNAFHADVVKAIASNSSRRMAGSMDLLSLCKSLSGSRKMTQRSFGTDAKNHS
jgi:hypothetical protein